MQARGSQPAQTLTLSNAAIAAQWTVDAGRLRFIRLGEPNGATLDPARTGVERIGPGGSLQLVEDRDGQRRELTVRRGPDGQPVYDYRENGARRPYDAAARGWTADALDGR